MDDRDDPDYIPDIDDKTYQGALTGAAIMGVILWFAGGWVVGMLAAGLHFLLARPSRIPQAWPKWLRWMMRGQ